uniref:G0/G1 switch 2 n=1 Tax=Acanthochromis polyacanthus TaxID=80966 RepID=A0A3Q1EJP7_9TELE
MESIQELIPFAKEMLSQKPSRGLLKVYLVGSLFAVLGTVVGLVETMCHPFLSSQNNMHSKVIHLHRQLLSIKT